MRPHNWPNILSIASLIALSLRPVNSFWMRILWKNGANGQAVLDDFNDEIPDPSKFSLTGRYSDGAYECSSLQSLTEFGGPEDPAPGIISVINSPRLGVYVHYLFFYENDDCGISPTMILKFLPPLSKVTPDGDTFVFDLMDRGLPPFRSWKQANPRNKLDKALVQAFDAESSNIVRSSNPSCMLLYIPDQGGVMRWRSIVNIEPAQPQNFLATSDSTVEKSLARSLQTAYAKWWTKEQAYQAKQANLNTDLGSKDFNFIAQPLPMAREKVASYMMGYELVREHSEDPRAQELKFLMDITEPNGQEQQGQPNSEYLDQDVEEALEGTETGTWFEDMGWVPTDNWQQK
ncbi:hypothetical protein ABW21_db0201323 [Orbilia brochopaga]|nr:hypothetical protein ABW21_db0201323 [Drechslerella brochopaga]